MINKYVCENGHKFDEPELLWNCMDLVKCCPVEGCTAGENWRKIDEDEDKNTR